MICACVLDIEREQDIERLRQVARLQKSQLEHLIAVLARKCAELEKLKGSGHRSDRVPGRGRHTSAALIRSGRATRGFPGGHPSRSLTLVRAEHDQRRVGWRAR